MHVMIPVHDAHPKDVATKVKVKQLSKVSARVNMYVYRAFVRVAKPRQKSKVYVCICAYIYVHTYKCMYVCMYTSGTYIYIYLCVYIYLCLYLCIYFL